MPANGSFLALHLSDLHFGNHNREGAFPVLVLLRDVARRWQQKECQGHTRSFDAFLESWVAEKMGAGWDGH